MRLLVLAGGFGTRLKDILKGIPKPLAPIGQKPFLEILLDNWMAQGICEFTFLLHHDSALIIDFLKSYSFRRNPQCKIDWIVERIPLDTGGSIANAVLQLGIKEDFMVANADTWLSSGIASLSSLPSPSLASVFVHDVGRFGELFFDENFFVSSFNEKDNTKRLGGWINAGLFCFAPRFFLGWNGDSFSLERDLLPNLVEKKLLRVSILKEVDFMDIGIPEDYFSFCKKFNSNLGDKSGF